MTVQQKSSKATIYRLRALFFSLIVLFSILFLGIAVASVPECAVPVSTMYKGNVLSLMPEGWAFFTRNPREEKMHIYKRLANGKWDVVNVPGSSMRFFFGLDRKGRAIGTEASTLLKQLKNDDWHDMRSPLDEVLQADSLPVIYVVNNVSNPVCTGDLIVELRAILPWAWSRTPTKTIMPYKIVRLHVKANRS